MQMQTMPFEVLAPAGQTLGESASWCPRTQSLWWVDIRAPHVKRWRSATNVIDVWPLPELCGAVVPTVGDAVVVALRAGLHVLDPHTGTLTALVTVEAGHPEHRLNEAKCDRQGRLWCGSMWDFGKHPTGSLYRVGPDLATHRARSAVTIPNGIGFSPDGRRMVFVDTITGRIECADYDLQDGMPGPWSTLVDANVVPGKPDGGAVDAEGCIWSTRFGASCVARFTPQGELDRLIHLPVSQPTSCSFGGPNLDTLFITSATQRMPPEALAAEPLAGAVLALRPGVQGLPEPAFRWTAPTHAHRATLTP